MYQIVLTWCLQSVELFDLFLHDELNLNSLADEQVSECLK